MKRLLLAASALTLLGAGPGEILISDVEWRAFVSAAKRHCATVTARDEKYACEHALGDLRGDRAALHERWRGEEVLAVSCSCSDVTMTVEAAREGKRFRVLRVSTFARTAF